MKSEESVKHTLKWKRTRPSRQISLLRKGRFPHNCLNIKVGYYILMYPKYLLAYFAFLSWRTLLLRWPVVSTRRLVVAPRWVWCKDQWWASVAVPILLLSLSVLLYYMLISISDGPSSQVWLTENKSSLHLSDVRWVLRYLEGPIRSMRAAAAVWQFWRLVFDGYPFICRLMFAHYSLCTSPTRSA